MEETGETFGCVGRAGSVKKMRDSYGREIDYMRISITDRCNLRCKYCMPKGISWLPQEEILTLEEIRDVCSQAASIGIRKIKVTGGEPLVRRGCPALVSMLKQVPGICQVTLTTNGVLLKEYVQELAEAGLDGMNVSLDTLDEETYAAITGTAALPNVLEGLRETEKYGIPTKINAVLQKGVNEDEWRTLAELARDRKVDVRFIEMMPIGYGKGYEPVSNRILLERMKEFYGELQPESRIHGNGPAAYYRIPGFQGCIGVISPIHGKFCSHCNRIRMTATGQLKSCLCYDSTVSVKEAVRQGNQEEVKRLLMEAITGKQREHCFDHRETITEYKEMARIGG